MISNTSITIAAVMAGLMTVGVYIPICKVKEVGENFDKELSKIEDEVLDEIENRLFHVASATLPEKIVGMPLEERLLISKITLELKECMEELDRVRDKVPGFFKLMVPGTLSKIAEARQNALFKCMDKTNELVETTNKILNQEIEEAN